MDWNLLPMISKSGDMWICIRMIDYEIKIFILCMQ